MRQGAVIVISAIVGLAGVGIGLHDLSAVGATAPRVLAAVVVVLGLGLIASTLPERLIGPSGATIRVVAAAGSAAIVGGAGVSRWYFLGWDAGVLLALAVALLLGGMAIWSASGWQRIERDWLRGAAKSVTALVSVSLLVSAGKTLWSGLHPPQFHAPTLNVSTHLQKVGTRGDMTLVAGTITLANPTDEQVNILASVYYVAGFRLRPPANPSTDATRRAIRGDETVDRGPADAYAEQRGFKLAQAGQATDQAWLNPNESTTRRFIAALPTGGTAVARLSTTLLVSRGAVKRQEQHVRDGVVHTTFEIQQPSVILRFAQGRRFMDAETFPADWTSDLSGTPRSGIIPAIDVRPIGVLGHRVRDHSLRDRAATDSTTDVFLAAPGRGG